MGSGSLQRMAAKKEKRNIATKYYGLREIQKPKRAHKLKQIVQLVHTFACNIGAKPLSRVVVKEAFGMGKTDRDIAGIAGEFEHSLQRKRGGLWAPIVGGMLHHWRIQAIDYGRNKGKNPLHNLEEKSL